MSANGEAARKTFSRVEATADQKVLDGHRIRIPDAPRLIALKLHATRDATRRTTETDWQDIAGLVMAADLSLEDPELGAIISDMEESKRSLRSNDESETRENSDLLRLPTPREPLREWTEQEIKPEFIIAAMEILMQIAKARPDFEAQRLERKTPVKFKY
jgi:hypothetical protein